MIVQRTEPRALVLTVACLAGCPAPSSVDNNPPASRPHVESRPQTGPGSGGKTGATPPPRPHPQAMFRGGPTRQGRTAQAIPRAVPGILWVHATGRPVFSSPAVDRAGNVLVGSLDHHVYSLRPDGKLRWKLKLDGPIYSSPALVAGGVLVGTDGDRLHLLEADKGASRWSVALGACGRNPGFGQDNVRCHGDASPAVGPGGDVYMGGDALYAFTAGGKLRWRFELGDHARSSPVIGPDGAVYIGSQADAVHAVTARGTSKWKFTGKDAFDSTGALSGDGALIIGCDNGRVLALELATGKLRWKFSTRGAVRSSPAVSGKGVVLVGSDDHHLYALDRTSGALRWAFKTGGRVRSSPVVDRNGTVVFGSQDDHLRALDARGKLLWELRLGGDVDSSVAVGPDGVMVVGADDGRVYALAPLRKNKEQPNSKRTRKK